MNVLQTLTTGGVFLIVCVYETNMVKNKQKNKTKAGCWGRTECLSTSVFSAAGCRRVFSALFPDSLQVWSENHLIYLLEKSS